MGHNDENGLKKKKDKKDKKKRKRDSVEASKKKDKKDKKDVSKESLKKSKKQKVKEDTSNGEVIKKEEIIENGKAYKESNMTKEELKSFREEHSITIESDKEFYPITSFDQLCLPENFKHGLKDFTKPTPIQSQCWPIALEGRDIVGIAETGSGKTLAFSIPMLYHIQNKTKEKNPVALILSPTRELATQTAQVCKEISSKSNLRTECLYGGVDKGKQFKACKKGLDIIVCTPGRLIDLMDDGAISLSDVCFFVLDEADRMLDLGFERDIRRIANSISDERQTLMFSATWPNSVQRISNDYLRNPVKVTIGLKDNLNANTNIKQIVEVTEPKFKDSKLRELLKRYHDGSNKVIVFVLYKKEASRVENMLRNNGLNAIGIHSDKSQDQRNKALHAFKTGKSPILVATDVAARGLDVPDVEYVINYSFPLTIEDYVHRIGRTGRANKKGVAHTFFTSFDKPRSGELIHVLKTAGQKVPKELMKFGTYIKKPKEDQSVGFIDLEAPQSGVMRFD